MKSDESLLLTDTFNVIINANSNSEWVTIKAQNETKKEGIS
jgi:hypothetical protein